MKKRRVSSFLVVTCYSLSLCVSSGMTVEALEGFGVSSEKTVKISSSVLSVMAPLVVEAGKTETLDLSGITLSVSSGSVVTVGKGATLTLSNGTISGGTGTISTGNNRQGGGIFVGEGATLILENVTVTGNTATHGGGVYLESGATLEMKGKTSITGNTVTNEGGGVKGGVATVMMSDSSSITKNSSFDGGGVNLAAGTLQMSGSSSITSNVATGYGGGVYLYGSTLEMESAAKITNNTATTSGGGIQILGGGKVYLKDSVQVIGNKGNGETQNVTANFDYTHLFVEALNSSASIGLSIVSGGTYHTGKMGTGYGGYSISEDVKKLFFSDCSDYGVLLENNVLSIGEIKTPTYIVSFKDKFHKTIEKEVNEGSAVSEEKPTESGYAFLGWYEDESGKKPFNFSTKITEDRTLYALWMEEEVEEPEEEIPPTTSTTTPSVSPSTTTTTTTTPTVPEVEEQTTTDPTTSTTTPSTTTTTPSTTTTTPSTTTTTPSTTPTVPEVEETTTETTTPSTTTTPTVPEVEEDEQEEDTTTETTTPSTTTPEVEEPEIEEEPKEDVEESEDDEEEPDEDAEEPDDEEPEEEDEESETTETPSAGGSIPGIFDPEKPFYDVQPWDWFYEQVYQVFSQGLMAGTSETEFSPYINTTRGMVATILYQFDGKPQTNQEVPYPDVNEGDYFAVPVAWALEHGVFAGYDDGLFRPHQQITREDLALVLFRYTEKQGGETGVKSGALLSFYDVATVSAYAWEGLSWAVSQGVMEGRTGNVIGAKDPATRSEMATMLTHLLRIVR